MAQYETSGEETKESLTGSPDLEEGTKSSLGTIIDRETDASGNVKVSSVSSVEDLDTATKGGEGRPTISEIDTTVLVDTETTFEEDSSPVLIFKGSSNVQARLRGNDDTERVVVSGEGNDELVVEGGRATIEGGGGNDTIEAAAGDDVITGGAGDDSVFGGLGNDTIFSGVGNDSVDAGDGFDTATMKQGGGAEAYTFEVINGEVTTSNTSGDVVVTNATTGETTVFSNTDYIDLGDGDAIINTSNTEDGTAARQSEAILGRQMTAEELEEYQQLVDEIGLDAASGQLMEESGFAADTADLTDLEYINLLYNQTFGRDVDPEGRDFYLQQLADGEIDRAKLAADLSWSDEGIDSNDLVNEIDGLV